jgi:hypothetical protein
MEREQILWGWAPALDIPVALGRMDQRQLDESHVLITILDSTPEVNRMRPVRAAIERLEIDCRSLGGGLVVPGSSLGRLDMAYGLLDGFDEIWLFENPPIEPKPDSVPLTSDIKLLQGPPEFLSDWLFRNSGIAGLGDGDGLNWITVSPSLAENWSA